MMGFRLKGSASSVAAKPLRYHVPTALYLVALLCTSDLRSQDIHFSQFFNTPYATNPASIGLFDGEYRAGGVFRQQWRSVTTPYRTFGLGGDAANFAGVRGLGAGAWLYNDRAGDSRLNTFHLSLGASWTKKLNAAKGETITGGLQFGFTTISIDYSALRFDAQFNGFYFDPSLANNEHFQRNGLTHPDLHAGAIYRYAPVKAGSTAERELVQAGFALFNITAPDVSFNGKNSPLDLRSTLHVITRFPVSEKLDVQPMAQFMTQGKFREFDIGGTVRFIMLDRYTMLRTLQAGLFWRARDAGYLFVGSEYDDWTLGISYDINLSGLVPASRNKGGLELTAVRVFRKKPVVPARFKACPTQL